MIIRPATGEDIPALMKLAGSAATAAQWTEAQYRTVLLGEHPKRILLVLELDSAGVVGFVVGADVSREWELENIVVASPEQRRGLGSKLLNAFLDHARNSGAASLFLEVRASNSKACAFYEKWGFQISGRRPGYYHNPPEDAILYKRIF